MNHRVVFDQLKLMLDDTRENPVPYKYESGPRPDCTIKLFIEDIVFDALQ